LQRVETAQAIAGAGLVGDRYHAGNGTFSQTVHAAANSASTSLPSGATGFAGAAGTSASTSKNTGKASGAQAPDRQVTLIEAEALEAAARDYEVAIDAAQSRRNLLVRGVPLNHLVGQEFLIGQVRLRGLRLCEPCGHLEKLTVTGIKSALQHRGGLRAEILTDGTLHPGDCVRIA
jgi:MOSC domain-containing protein YiiM